MSPADWRHDVNPRGKYMPGKPAWYMYDSCQSKRSDSIGVLCSAVSGHKTMACNCKT